MPIKTAGDLCPNGVPKSFYVSADELVRPNILRWFENTSKMTKQEISRAYKDLLNNTVQRNKTRERTVKAILAVVEDLSYQIDYFYALANGALVDPCDHITNGPTTHLIALTQVIIADVGSMVEMQQEIEHGGCLLGDYLESCLTELDTAVGILDRRAGEAFNRPVSDSCFDSKFFNADNSKSNSIDTYLSYIPEAYSQQVYQDLKQMILNSEKLAWGALKKQYNDYSNLGNDELSVLKKIALAKIVIKYDNLYEEMKAADCA